MTKEGVFIPCHIADTAQDMANLLLEHVFKCSGLPDKIISDRGLLFTAKTMQAMVKQLHIRWNHSTAYHPQTNGQTKHVNQEVETYLCLYCHNYPN